MDRGAHRSRRGTAAAGWHLLASLAGGGREAKAAASDGGLRDDDFAALLEHIEQHIHSCPNRVRHSMNGALIAIGLRSPALQKQALAAAKRIGRVEVDHGETACKTPDAAAYIRKASERRSGKKAANRPATKTAKKVRATRAPGRQSR